MGPTTMAKASGELSFQNVFSIADFCEWSGLGRTKVFAEISAGRLQARRAGGRTLIPAEEAIRWLRSLPLARAAEESEGEV